MKETILVALGCVGSFISSLFGGWSAGLTTLCFFMLVDCVTGMIVAWLQKSNKTETGGVESKAFVKGLFRKFFIICIVFVAAQIDILMGVTYIKDATVIAFIVNETISILENAGLMGVPIPAAVKNALELLKKKEDK